MNCRLKDKWPWTLAAIILLGLFAAFALPRMMLHLAPWWRFPVVTMGVFDSYLYYQWLGSAAQSVPYGGFFYWLEPVFRGLWRLTGGAWSLPEFALLILLLMMALSCVVLPWVLRAWSGSTARAQTLLIGFAFLLAWGWSIGFRPGIYGWYFPFVLFGMGCLAKYFRAVLDGKMLPAVCWVAGAVFLTLLYPWFLGFAIVFIAAVAWWRLLHRKRSWGLAIFFVATALGAVASELVAPFVMSPAFRATIDQYERTGVTFTHLPFIANTAAVLVLWPVLLAWRSRARGELSRETLLAVVAWLCLLVLWFDYPLTGLHIYNDHFITVANVLGFLTLGLVLLDDRPSPIPPSKRRYPLALSALAGFAFLYYVAQSLHAGAYVVSYVQHVFNWGFLLLASISLLGVHPRRLQLIAVASCFVLGVWGLAQFIQRELPDYPSLLSQIAVIDWIRADGSPTTRYCTDPATATVLGPHTGRRFYPAEAIIHAKETTDVFLARMAALATVFDFARAGFEPQVDAYINYGQQVACLQFPLQSVLLQRLGFSRTAINGLTGCREAEVAQRLAFFHAAEQNPSSIRVSPALFCDRYIVRDDLASYWRLPAAAKRLAHVDHATLWSSRP